MFKQAQTEALYAEEKSPSIILGTYFAKAKTNSQLFLDSRKGGEPFLSSCRGQGRPFPAAPPAPCRAPASGAGHIHTTPCSWALSSEWHSTASGLPYQLVVLETASTYTMAG